MVKKPVLAAPPPTINTGMMIFSDQGKYYATITDDDALLFDVIGDTTEEQIANLKDLASIMQSDDSELLVDRLPSVLDLGQVSADEAVRILYVDTSSLFFEDATIFVTDAGAALIGFLEEAGDALLAAVLAI